MTGRDTFALRTAASLLAGALARLCGDEAARVAMGRAGERRARDEFSLDRHLDAMEQVFRSVVA